MGLKRDDMTRWKTGKLTTTAFTTTHPYQNANNHIILAHIITHPYKVGPHIISMAEHYIIVPPTAGNWLIINTRKGTRKGCKSAQWLTIVASGGKFSYINLTVDFVDFVLIHFKT